MAGRPYGKYTLIAKLATGGMAEIFLAKAAPQSGEGAQASPTDRLVVIKKILDQLCAEAHFVAMFLDEARIAARLNHPNIVQIHDLGQVTDDNTGAASYYIAMEYLPGESLGAIARRGAARQNFIPAEYACRVMAEVLKGLQYANTLKDPDGRPLNIVHRDVAPKNIVVTYDGQVKLVDFGIAKAARKSTRTQVGVVKGTYQYMSPEQVKSGEIDGRSDLFACGVVLYELCTGTRLFKFDEPLECMKAIREMPIVPPRQLHPALPERLEGIILKALERDPAERYQTAQEMAAALDDYLAFSRVPVGRGELGGYMGELFADRIAQAKALLEAALAKDWESFLFEREKEAEDASDDEGTAGSIVVRKRDAGAAEPGDRTHAAALPIGLLAQLARAKRMMRIAIAVGVVAVIGAVAAFALRPVPPALEVVSEPPGAAVTVDGKPVPGATPLVVPLPPGVHDVGLRLAGFKPVARTGEVPRKGNGRFFEQLVVEPGVVAVTTEPGGARLTIDGKEGPIAPASLELLPGLHSISAELEGYSRAVETVTVESGDSRHLPIKLAAAPRPAAETPTAVAPPTPPSHPAPPRPAKAATPAARPGLLTLSTEPWSTVYLGSRRLGDAPIVQERVPAGTHQLTLVNPGKGLRAQVTVTIEPGKELVKKFAFDAAGRPVELR